jgi:hypoxanthine phosphoribosyltransferase
MFSKKKVMYTWKEFDKDVIRIKEYLKRKKYHIYGVYGIPKGGLPLAVTLANHLNLDLILDLNNFYTLSSFNEHKLLIVDDISDKGDTMLKLPVSADLIKITLFKKEGSKFIPEFYCRDCKKNDWIVFCWESLEKKAKRDGTF